MSLNKGKSHALLIRADRRTRRRSKSIGGIELTDQARYLGVVIDDDLSLRHECKELSKWLSKQHAWLSACMNKLPGQKYTVWKTLCESSQLHKLLVMAAHSRNARSKAADFYYRSFLQLAGAGRRVKRLTALNLFLGDTERFFKAKYDLIVNKATLDEVELARHRQLIAATNAKARFAALAEHRNIVLLHLNSLFSPNVKV